MLCRRKMNSSFRNDDFKLTPKELQVQYTVKKPPKLDRSSKNHYGEAYSTPTFLMSSTENLLSACKDSASMSGSVFHDSFTIIQLLGEGSFGKVYKVKSHLDKKIYAVKVAKTRFKNETERQMRLAEVKLHEQLSSHTNIVQLLEAWEEQRIIYMQLELCKINLQALSFEMKMPEQMVWDILVDMLSALAYIHELQYVHLDVKLENILVGYDGRYKLGDFGLIYNMSGELIKDPLEGDPKYLAPEVLSGVISPAADIFSLGISVLELAAHVVLPNNGPLWQDLRHDMLPTSQVAGLSHELVNTVTWMMNSNFRSRPSANELLDRCDVLPRIKSRKQVLALSDIKYFLISAIKYIVYTPFQKLVDAFTHLTNHLSNMRHLCTIDTPSLNLVEIKNKEIDYQEENNDSVSSKKDDYDSSPQLKRRFNKNRAEFMLVKRQLFSSFSDDSDD